MATHRLQLQASKVTDTIKSTSNQHEEINIVFLNERGIFNCSHYNHCCPSICFSFTGRSTTDEAGTGKESGRTGNGAAKSDRKAGAKYRAPGRQKAE